MSKKPKKQVVPATPSLAPRNLNAIEAARYLGVGVWALRHLHWNGVLRGIFIGRKLLFDKATLDCYVDALVKAR